MIRHPRPLPRLALASVCALAASLAACGSSGGSSSADAEYTITLRYCSVAGFSSCTADPNTQATLDEIPQYVRDAFEAARVEAEGLVTAGLRPAKTSGLTCQGSTSSVAMNETVHGLLILVTVGDLSGYGVIASSGPCIARVSNHLPLVAVMQFSSSYVDTLGDKLSGVALHEMLHTMGFGTIWEDFSPPLIIGAGTAAPGFTGEDALMAAKDENGAPSGWTTVPLETSGGEGTRDSHWENTYFGNELMTGYVTGVIGPLSATTVGAMRDLGYQVDMTKAEPFTILDPSALRALTSAPALDLGEDVLRIPLQYADDTAEVP